MNNVIITYMLYYTVYVQLSPDIRKLVQGVVSESKTDAAKDEFEVNHQSMIY